MKFKIYFLFIAALFLFGCTSQEDPSLVAGRVLSVGCSNQILADIVSEIAGNRAHVFVFGDQAFHGNINSQEIKKADFLVLLGDGCESEFKQIKKSYKSKIIPVLDSLNANLIKEDEIQAGRKDCHFWFDDRLIDAVSKTIEAKFASFDPHNQSYYTSNRASFSSEVTNSFSKFKTLLNHVPKSQRVLVTTHNGFAYFGDRFSFETYGLWVSDEKGVTDRDISRLSDFVVRRWVRYVFVEYPLEDAFIDKLNLSVQEKGWEVTIHPVFIHDLQFGTTSNISLLDGVEKNVRQFRQLLGSDLDAMTIDDYLSSFD
jgi:manganese/zinc/iron transport system substrate-binding protein